MKTIPVRELKNNLPIGILSDGKRHCDFTLRPYTGIIDRQLAMWSQENSDVQEKDRAKFEFRKIAKHLSLLLERVGEVSFPLDAKGQGTAEAELRVLQMALPDVLYAYIVARIKALGEHFDLPFTCPHCKAVSKIRFDLNDIEVKVPETEDEISFWVDLKTPIPVGDRSLARALKISPLTLSSVVSGGYGGKVNNAMDLVAIQSAVTAARVQSGDIPFQMSDAEVDKLTKLDILHLTRETNLRMSGPNVVLDITCPKCGAESSDILDWSYTFFFELSFHLSHSNF